MRAILEANDVIEERGDAREPQPLKGEIKFENVAFAYNKDAPVLTDVNFQIQAGQMVGVVGPTGGGKSTIVSLIPRFYDPSAGKVSIDGVDIRDYNSGLRNQIAYVLQETVLFRGTVAENIAYGRGSATRDEIVKQQTGERRQFIAKMPQDTTPWWATVETPFQADSASALELRGRSFAIIRF